MLNAAADVQRPLGRAEPEGGNDVVVELLDEDEEVVGQPAVPQVAKDGLVGEGGKGSSKWMAKSLCSILAAKVA